MASDVLIVPASSRFVPRHTWWRALGIDTEPPVAAGTGRARRFTDEVGFDRPAWILNVAHDGRPSVPWLIDGLADALRKISADHPPTGDGRVRPLIAMPTLGVGLGGYDGVRGAVIKALLERTAEFVRSSAFDIVIVAENAADYAAFQSMRREGPPPPHWSQAAEDLASAVRRDDVALLLGAGVSVPAGLPTWDQLLSQLKSDTLPDLDDTKFAELNVLDRAQLLSKASGATTLGARTARAIGAVTQKSPTLAHCLLASLGVERAVTTNYDTLYEDAYESAHGSDSISVLPRQEVHGDRSWLLKLHGDVAAPDSIVLSRRDFVRYDSERRPLASIVQSLMATNHVVVIGASMTDDNVLRLAHEVLAMNAVNKHERPLGTVVTLRPDPVRAALWEGDFRFVSASDSPDDAVAARDLEIMLDRVAMYASDHTPFLVDSRYGELLDTEEKQLAQDLRDIADRVRALDSTKRDRWAPLGKTLKSMGDAEPMT
ncbi:SIR2 family protein [Rhodococcus sp. MEB041]|uniref:SIR2 family protein n=1 Tax=Rhodococcus sp. MEB041 TaxID=3040323 RepID=UPI00254A19E9|nr:SIR2 family protein [Rhodococcus sp. MEB041]